MSSDNTDALVVEISPKKKIATIIFYIGILCELIVSFSGYAYGGYREPIIIVAGMSCFALKIMLSIDYRRFLNFIKKYAVWYGLILGYGCICYVVQGSALVLRIGLMILAGRDQKARDVIRVFFWGTVGVMLVTAVLSMAGLHNELYIHDLFRHVPETRYCFGFYHPNGFALFLVRAIIMGIYLYAQRLKWWGWLLSGAIIVPVMVLVNSKMAYACVIVVVFIALTIHLIERNKSKIPTGTDKIINKEESSNIKQETHINNDGKVHKVIFALGLIIMVSELFAIFIYCVNFNHISEIIMDENNIWYYINALTSGRLYSAASVWNEGLPTLFGVKNLVNGTEIGFFNAMYGQGVLFIVIYLMIQFYLYVISYQRQEYFGMLLVLGFAIYSLSEAFIPYVNKDAVWMLLIGETGVIRTNCNAVDYQSQVDIQSFNI